MYVGRRVLCFCQELAEARKKKRKRHYDLEQVCVEYSLLYFASINSLNWNELTSMVDLTHCFYSGFNYYIVLIYVCFCFFEL